MPENKEYVVPINHYLKATSKLWFGMKIGCTLFRENNDIQDRINMEEELIKAFIGGDATLIKLMEQLKDFVTVVSQEYRTCLSKQIEVTKTAQEIGPLSEAWDELPQYRTLAQQLNNELNEYITVFNIIGQMANEQSLNNLIEGSTLNIDIIIEKFKKLEIIVKKELVSNKNAERELLEFKCDNIVDNFM